MAMSKHKQVRFSTRTKRALVRQTGVDLGNVLLSAPTPGKSRVIPRWVRAAAKHAGMTPKAFWAASNAEHVARRQRAWEAAKRETMDSVSDTPEQQWAAVKTRLQCVVDRFDRYMETHRPCREALAKELANLAFEATDLVRRYGP